jgi:hypothetical protein
MPCHHASKFCAVAIYTQLVEVLMKNAPSFKKKNRYFPKSTINISSLYAGRPKIGIFFAVIMLGQLFSVDILSSDLRHRAAYFVCIDVSGAKVLH